MYELHTQMLQACDSFTCPEALLWPPAIDFHKLRSRIYPTSALRQFCSFMKCLACLAFGLPG